MKKHLYTRQLSRQQEDFTILNTLQTAICRVLFLDTFIMITINV